MTVCRIDLRPDLRKEAWGKTPTGSITWKRLREVLHYSPATGDWTWLISPSKSVRAYTAAGWINEAGYRRIDVDGGRYLAHRLAWLYLTMEWPKDQIDHRNLDKADNRWSNLREATSSQNNANKRADRDSKSGFRGVCRAPYGRWAATCKRNHLGYFDTSEEAHAAYCRAATMFSGEFASYRAFSSWNVAPPAAGMLSEVPI